MSKKSMYFSITIISMILGVMLAIQFRTNRYIEQSVTADRAQEVVAEMSLLDKDKQKLDKEIYDLSYKLEQARKGQSQAQAAIVDEMRKAKMVAGLTAVTGPGIEVELDNQSAASGIYVRDEYLLKIANELKGAGAEAISVNGHRLISISEIRMAGSFININLERTEPPFHILAIGNPDKLKSSLEISGGLVDYFKDLGIEVRAQSHSNVTVPGYNRDLQYNYAKPVKG